MYSVYIVRCADGTFYTGITVDLKRRIIEHNSLKLGARYTRTRRPVKLVYAKKYRTRSMASKAEARIKALPRREKLKVIQRGK
ncbi:MAG: endonuclease [Candidatus Kerfeldbacteria bacterium RIFCSPLOWO2_01_FULL_48_11]|uniref:Endonuclease n=1 Tax=Candidatus Kerfeldbacteria bacterium RIFCSPLOWO2_01_FULL_48_11 TaxID=1798543 RepID=A0A1G2B4C3_9BACT|nr:MAG: endonuclease [Candidatus Kerfeldbacteria bacterium RIFCSPLOWO2_01_FULL_48_11]HCM68716.1 endonuclease [Candidatus Kerfeldbacteria bacterium]